MFVTLEGPYNTFLAPLPYPFPAIAISKILRFKLFQKI